jgi:hypothetical protein
MGDGKLGFGIWDLAKRKPCGMYNVEGKGK